MNDLRTWLHSSTAKAKFFLSDLTRKPMPDKVAIVEQDESFVKGVIVETMRTGDLGALWWTTRDDVQTGLEMGYFDVSKEQPVISEAQCAKARLTFQSPVPEHGQSR
jgi:hypothetical protein